MHVCTECFDATGLQRRIKEVRPGLEWTPCDFHPRRKGVPIKMVAEIVDDVFRAHYVGGPDDIWGTAQGDDLNTVLFDLVQAENDRIVDRLREWLIDNDSYWSPDGEDAFYSDEYVYSSDEVALDEHGRLWEVFCRKLLHDARFFNEEAQRLLTRIFEGVHLQRTAGRLGPVYIVKPGDALSRFYRARKADDEASQKKIRDDLVKELGPPPERLRRAGRLNAAGVPAFYGAFDLDTCIAELRPLVGGTVMTAEFEITAPIRVLDTTRFEAVPKPHDPFTRNAVQRAAQWRFMHTFMLQIAQPVSPDDEHLSYVPTQAVAEYLARRHIFSFDGKSQGFDAVIYKSAQHEGGRNIALFGDAAKVTSPAKRARPARSASDRDEFWDFLDNDLPKPGRIQLVSDSLKAFKVSGAHFPTVMLDD